jgi:hypothetical protein
MNAERKKVLEMLAEGLRKPRRHPPLQKQVCPNIYL